MKSKISGSFFLFAVMMMSVTAFFIYRNHGKGVEALQEEQIIAVNEVEQLLSTGNTGLAEKKLSSLQSNLRGENSMDAYGGKDMQLVVLCLLTLLFTGALFLYLYFSVLRPFEKLGDFAENIARGDFNIPLTYERTNYFGRFTWAFDHMRKEIIKARQSEKEAVENNKTVIVALSHDIKTPIASIRAYAEGLEANLDTTMEKREKYISVIMRKCDEVSKLTSDLFLHALSDLDKLKIKPQRIELCSFMENAAVEISAERKDIFYKKPGFEVFVSADQARLLQVMENLINNARKYAKTEIQIFIEQKENLVEIHVKDFGDGIPDEDMPFIFDKFYRGKNCGEEQGSGLGLYIVKYIMEKMEGDVRLQSRRDGFEVILSLSAKTEKAN